MIKNVINLWLSANFLEVPVQFCLQGRDDSVLLNSTKENQAQRGEFLNQIIEGFELIGRKIW